MDCQPAHVLYRVHHDVLFYLIPALLNIQLVLLMEIKKDQGSMADGEHVIQKGLLIILMYLAVFSNLFASQILAV